MTNHQEQQQGEVEAARRRIDELVAELLVAGAPDLLRAYAAIDDETVRHRLLALAEAIAGISS
jgi:hypothetical protein